MPAATVGILAGAFADPAASLVGSKYGGDGVKKCWAGSAAAASVAAIVLLLVGIPLIPAIAGALTAMVLERWSGPLNDNLVVPPGVALVVLLLL
jgi:dolichol kinase